MKRTKLISTTALLTFALLCIAPPMASADGKGSVSKADVAAMTKAATRAPKNGTMDTPEPITGLLALAAAGVGGAAARKRKKQQDQD